MYFDVDKTGKVFSAVDGGSDSLSISNKEFAKSIKDSHVTVMNYGSDTYNVETGANAGAGVISNVITSDFDEIDMTETIKEIKESVVAWLNHHHFESTIDVMENGNKYDQASLLACFNKPDNIVPDMV